MQQATWWIDALSNITTDRDYYQAALQKYVSTDIAYHKVNVFNTSCSHHANSRNMCSIHVDNQFVGNSYNLPRL